MSKSTYATDEEILGEHLPYELWMLEETFTRLNQSKTDVVLTNALIEAFCIHARQLLEFFENKQGRKAKEFTGGSYAAAHLGALTKLERDKLNTQIAHITGKRTADSVDKIDQILRAKFLRALMKEANDFKKQLAPEFQGLFRYPMANESIASSDNPSATNAPTSTTGLSS